MRPGKRLFALLVVSACSMAACAEIVGIDEWDPQAATTSSSGTTGATTTGTGGGTAGAGGDTTATAGTGGATSSASGGGGTGGSGELPGEVCDNGIDDDTDGAVDCDDVECDAYACVEPAPVGWMGPVALLLEPSLAMTCTKPYPAEVVDGGTGPVSAPPATCGACACSPPTGTCTAPDVFPHVDGGCGDFNSQVAGVGTTCTDTGSFSGYASVTGAPANPSVAGTCAASGGVAAVDTKPMFATRVTVCGGATVGACGSTGQLCAPKPEGPFQGTCISRAGDMVCPAGPYTVRSVVFGGVDDTRGCSACTCGAANGVNCFGQTLLFSDNTCQVYAGAAQHGGSPQCDALQSGDIGSVLFVPIANGTCPTSGGAPIGGAQGTVPFTVCCTP